MEKKKYNQNLKPSFPRVSRPAATKVNSKPPEEAKLSKLVPSKLPLNFNNLNTNKPRERLTEVKKIPSQLTEDQEVKILQDKIVKNNAVSFKKILRDLMNKYSKNRNEISDLKNERKLIQSSGEKLELLRGFVISEIEYFLNSQAYEHEEEEEFTYEELLELGDRIGKVSKGYSEEKIATLKIVAAPTCQSCSICLTVFESNERATLLSPCDHLYHIDCIKSWLLDHKTCPLCLQEIIL